MPRDLPLAFPGGAFAAVAGPSGCGRSTLTRPIARLMKPDRGEVWRPRDRVNGPRRTVGMAFRNPVMLDRRTIRQDVLLPLEIVAP
jgi:NitT/TauT family transport system ATP-binding protein